MEIVTNNFEFLENGLGITLVVFLPLISALVVALLPKKQELLIKLTALGSSLITFILSVIVAIQFDYSKAEQFQLGNKLSWIEAINSNYEIGIDGISLPMLLLSTFITVLAIIVRLRIKNIFTNYLVILFISCVLEIFHLIVPNRAFELYDLIANFTGVVIILFINSFIKWRKHY